MILINTQPSTQEKGLLFIRFGDGGPTVGNSTHKHLTEGDQRFYSSTEEPFLREARDVVNGGRSKKEN